MLQYIIYNRIKNNNKNKILNFNKNKLNIKKKYTIYCNKFKIKKILQTIKKFKFFNIKMIYKIYKDFIKTKKM